MSRGGVLLCAAAAQALGAAAAVALSLGAARILRIDVPAFALALLAGACAASAGRMLRLPPWWSPIHFGLPVLAWGGIAAALDPAWYLAAFAAAFLVFGATARTSVPLYLSGRDAIEALAALVPPGAEWRLLDAGCGVGTVLSGLASRRTRARLEGIESALLPWLVARLRALASGRRFEVKLGDLWAADFGRYDVVYAFLSPVPMARLWRKACAEMRPGSLLVSNCFPVPERPATLRVETRPGSGLHVWRF